MKAFLLLLGLFLFAFGASHLILDSEREMTLDQYMRSFEHTWLLMFGEFDEDDYDKNLRTLNGPIIFFLNTCIMPLIMLNLLIAIMSDTYANVMESIKDTDYKAMNIIIMQIEHYLFWKRNIGQPFHLFWFTYSSKKQSGGSGSITEAFKKPIEGVKSEMVNMLEDTQILT